MRDMQAHIAAIITVLAVGAVVIVGYAVLSFAKPETATALSLGYVAFIVSVVVLLRTLRRR